jgi:hypothetical protein
MQRLRQIFWLPGRLVPVFVLLAALVGGCGSGNDLSVPTE